MKISVIIPVKNGASTLVKCLNAIRCQTIADKIEIIVLDSMSTDNSVKLSEKFGAKIITIDPSAFNHGLTRNIGIKSASGELLFFTTQDAYLSERDQLENMAAHFDDRALQAVAGMQAIPSDLDKNPAAWFKRISKPVITYLHFTNAGFNRFSLKDQFRYTNTWDDVNAMYRKSALSSIPFAETQFAEDKLWAKEALLAGYKIAFDPSFVVYHYHHQDFHYAFRVQYTVNYHYYKYFHVYPSLKPFFKQLITSWYRLFKNRKLSLTKKLFWSFHNLSSLTGKYLSNLIFLIIVKLFSERGLDKSLGLFCGQIPQGRLKK